MRLRALCLAALVATGPAWAQDPGVATDVVPDTSAETVNVFDSTFPDQQDWSDFTDRVVLAIEAGAASNVVLGELRGQLVTWRDTFLERQSVNSSRISTVAAQIAALGAVPESGEEEPRIAARRAFLDAQLRELRAPATIAAEAYTQANGLIGEIDSLIRSRQTQQFLERSLSPLNPSGWTVAWSAVSGAVVSIKAEVVNAAANPSRRAEFSNALPAILALLAVALVFTLRGRLWFGLIADAIVARSRRAHGVVQFFLSLGQIIIPFLGVVALVNALQLTGMTGRRLGAVIEALPQYSLSAILAHWLAGQLLPSNTAEEAHPFAMSPKLSGRAHTRLILLGYMMLLFGLASVFVSSNTFGTVPAAVVMFPFGVLLSVALYLCGHIIRRNAADDDADAPRLFRVGLRTAFSRGLMLAAVAGLVLAALAMPTDSKK